jgi:hypothetical protein
MLSPAEEKAEIMHNLPCPAVHSVPQEGQVWQPFLSDMEAQKTVMTIMSSFLSILGRVALRLMRPSAH